ncbi:MAG: hypothetical protein K6A64_06575 [Bacteroidales bacterium]|nr:hypothetical protein [Bacteroidales bacterium]
MKKYYVAPLTELLTMTFESGFLTFSNGNGGANAAAMTENDELFDEWDS